MRKPDFCLRENKGADQLRRHFCACAVRFVLDLVGNPEDQFSRVTVHKCSEVLVQGCILLV